MSAPMKYWSISSEILKTEAEKLWLSVEIVDKDKNLFYISGNNKKILFKSTDFGWNSSLWHKIANDKQLTYKVLEWFWYPIAQTWYCSSHELDQIDSIDIVFPVIIKPLLEWHGNGVKMNIKDINELHTKLKESFQIYDKMIIQKQITWSEYRFLVVKWELILVRERDPAHVYWDWTHTIKELIDIENKINPLRWDWYNLPLSYIKVDGELIEFISKQSLHLNSVPTYNEKIYLRWNSNIWTWGISINRTFICHESIKRLTCDVAEYLQLQIAWIDIMTDDITKPIEDTWWVILEVNATPGIWWDIELTWVNTWKLILEKLFS